MKNVFNPNALIWVGLFLTPAGFPLIHLFFINNQKFELSPRKSLIC